MALTTLDPKIVDKLFLAKMVEYVHSGELERDYEEAKEAEEKFGRMRAQQVFVTEDGMSACEDVAEKVVEISSAHQADLQKAVSNSTTQAQVHAISESSTTKEKDIKPLPRCCSSCTE
ncbi:hypothetical protein LTR97_011758 [Elasticomyces elasticus]|uniref:Uncharacterized protein n=1 Tax=Elasticomyces elasticus TaxID=574655 RepID=A0AAN7ZZM3_9PEZI|nr:hypothetical protein LTR97_011758 [Elasticomyces elasticus]